MNVTFLTEGLCNILLNYYYWTPVHFVFKLVDIKNLKKKDQRNLVWSVIFSKTHLTSELFDKTQFYRIYQLSLSASSISHHDFI